MLDPAISEFKPFAEAMARQACQTVLAQRNSATTEIKPDGSPVTSVDRAVESVLRQSINRHHPDHGIIGEEYGGERLEAEYVWVIDPIDGTRSFVSGLPTYGVLIALCRGQQPVLGVICQPETHDVYLGITGEGTWRNGQAIRIDPVARLEQAICNVADPEAYDATTDAGYAALRRASRWTIYDGSCLGYGALAAGRLHVCLSGARMDRYDLLALVPVVVGSGGCISDWRGAPLTLHSKGAIVASAGTRLHEKVLALLASAGR